MTKTIAIVCVAAVALTGCSGTDPELAEAYDTGYSDGHAAAAAEVPVSPWVWPHETIIPPATTTPVEDQGAIGEGPFGPDDESTPFNTPKHVPEPVGLPDIYGPGGVGPIQVIWEMSNGDRISRRGGHGDAIVIPAGGDLVEVEVTDTAGVEHTVTFGLSRVEAESRR